MNIEKARDIISNFEGVVSSKPLDDIQSLLQCLLLTKEALLNLRTLALDDDFKDKDEEINYFKNIKPVIGGYLIFFDKLYYIEKNKEFGNLLKVTDNIASLKEEISRFADTNSSFLDMIHSDSVEQKSYYFTRIKPSDLSSELEYDIDYDHTSRGCKNMAKYHGYLRLNQYFNQLEQHQFSPNKQNDQLQWQGSSIQLVELLVALHEEGMFEAPFQEVCSFFSLYFNVKLSNPHRIKMDIRNRVKDKSKFTQKLANTVEAVLNYAAH